MYERDDLRRTDEETGVTLKIVHDADAESPVADDESVILAIFARNRINPAEKVLPTVEMAQAFVQANRDPDSEYAVFSVWAYEHGNILFKAVNIGSDNPFSDDWDSGSAGLIALKRADFGGDLLKTAKGICDTYSDWCNGEAYGYVVEDAEGGQIDALWGFVGDPEDDGAYSEGFPVWEEAVKDARERLADAAQAEADKAGSLAALIDAARSVLASADAEGCSDDLTVVSAPAAANLAAALDNWERWT